MSFLLDCRGEATHLRGPAHHSVGPRPSGHSQHVVHSGCVVYHCAPNAITIRFRPSLISPSALARIESWLDAKARHRMHLVYWLHDEWHHELLHTPKMAFKRIEALVSFAGGGRYGHVVRSIESPAHLDQGGFSDVISLWRERRESFEPEKLFPVMHARMQGRATLFDASTSPELRLIQPGEALTAGTRKWANRNPKLAVSQLPFYGASAPVFEGLQHANATLCPVHDKIEGFFMWPGHEPMRLSYRRLVLPFLAGDKRWVVSTTIADRRVNLLP